MSSGADLPIMVAVLIHQVGQKVHRSHDLRVRQFIAWEGIDKPLEDMTGGLQLTVFVAPVSAVLEAIAAKAPAIDICIPSSTLIDLRVPVPPCESNQKFFS